MNSSQNGIPHAGRTPNSASAPSTAMSLMKNQIFLGMVGSRIPLKSGIRNDVEESMAARIRFVFFSPRNMRRSKVKCNCMFHCFVCGTMTPLLAEQSINFESELVSKILT